MTTESTAPMILAALRAAHEAKIAAHFAVAEVTDKSAPDGFFVVLHVGVGGVDRLHVDWDDAAVCMGQMVVDAIKTREAASR